jgi:hypothetical protein
VLPEIGCVHELADAIRRVAEGVADQKQYNDTTSNSLPHLCDKFVSGPHTTLDVQPVCHLSFKEYTLTEGSRDVLCAIITAPVVGEKDATLKDIIYLDLSSAYRAIKSAVFDRV